MRATVRLDDNLLMQARREAERRGETLTSLLERGVRLAIASKPRAKARRYKLPVSKATGGVRLGVNISKSAELLDRLDGLE